MSRLQVLVLAVLSVGLLSVVPAYALERDYFTADEDPAARRDLTLNNQHHTDNVLKWLREGNVNMALQDVKFTITKWPNHPRALILLEVIAGVAHSQNLPIPYYEKAIKVGSGMVSAAELKSWQDVLEWIKKERQ